MIKGTIYFGNNNRFTLQFGLSTLCGDLINLIPMAIGKSYKDISYCICNGQLVGTDSCPLDRPLIDLGLVNGECTIHIILNTTKEPLDNVIRYRYAMWILKRNYGMFFDPSTAGGTAIVGGAAGAAGAYVDIPIVIPRSELDRYIGTRTCDSLDVACGICSLDIPVSEDMTYINVCNHVFHTECITRWLTESNVKCPMCNADVRNI